MTAGRICTGCGEFKVWEDFSRHPLGLNGRQPRCRLCQSIAGSIHHRKTYQDRRRKILAAQKSRRDQRLDVVRPVEATAKRLAYAINPEASRVHARKWKANNKDKLRAYNAIYRAERPEIMRARDARRRARKLGASGTLTASEWAEILRTYDHRCAYCFDGSKPLEQEHVVPLSRGGAHVMGNVVPACRECNAAKFTKTAREWILVAA